MFSLFFPDACRLCDRILDGFSAVPVCDSCLLSVRAQAVQAHCDTCGQPFEANDSSAQERRCGACRISLPAFDRARSFGIYEGNLRRLIHLLKYDKMRPLAKPLAGYMAGALDDFRRIDFCVPVPLYRWRRWRRGFNQAQLLAQQLSRASGIPCREHVLRRVKRTESQAGLSNRERRSNVAGAFGVPNSEAVRARSLLLVDDVMTTGATLDACAGALRRAGAEYIAAVTIARAKRRIIEVNAVTGGAAPGR